jgi:hypothetical protein
MKYMLCCFLALACGWQLFAQNSQARFIDISGSIEIKAKGSEAWVSAAPGTEIGKDMVISSGFKSTARIALGNSILTIRPLTRLTLEEIAQREGNEEVGLYLETGRVLFEKDNGQRVYVSADEQSYLDETQNRLIPPFEAETASLRPELGELGDTGSGGDTDAPVLVRPGEAGLSFEWL